MIEEVIPVVCQGQFFYVEGRQKHFAFYEVEVQLPKGETDRALQFIRRHLINEAVQSAFPEKGVTGIRTCAITSHLPDVKIEEAVAAVEEDDKDELFDQPLVSASEEFTDVEEIVGE